MPTRPTPQASDPVLVDRQLPNLRAGHKKARPGNTEAGSLVTELAFAPRRVRLPCEFVEGNDSP